MLYYFISILLIVIDQLVKWWVRANIPLGGTLPFLPHVLELTYVQNTGAAFSSFSGLTWVLALVSLAASAAVVVLMVKDFFPGRLGRFTLCLILAGAVGNLIDRVALGFVTDMFQTVFMEFAVFNVADICVVVGGVLMVVYVALFWDREVEKANGTSHM